MKLANGTLIIVYIDKDGETKAEMFKDVKKADSFWKKVYAEEGEPSYRVVNLKGGCVEILNAM